MAWIASKKLSTFVEKELRVSQVQIVNTGIDTIKVNVKLLDENGKPVKVQELSERFLGLLQAWQDGAKAENKPFPPSIGNVQLKKLTSTHIQDTYTRMQKAGLSPATVHAVHELLRMGLSQAVKGKLVTGNVTEDVSLPRIPQHETQTLTVEQAQKLLSVAKGHQIETLLTVALATGYLLACVTIYATGRND